METLRCGCPALTVNGVYEYGSPKPSPKGLLHKVNLRVTHVGDTTRHPYFGMADAALAEWVKSWV